MAYKPDIVIYHYPCTDGITAAAIVHDYYLDDDQTLPEEAGIQFVPAKYSKREGSAELTELCRGKKVLLLDYTYPPETMKAMASSAESILVLDHHMPTKAILESVSGMVEETRVDRVEDFFTNEENDKIVAWFDADRCGASLTWKFFHPDQPVPNFVQHVQNVDLNRIQSEDDEFFKWWSRGQPLDVETFADHLFMSEDELDDVFTSGAAMRDLIMHRIEQIRQEGTRDGIIGGIPFKWAISDYLMCSDIANSYIENGDARLGIGVYFTTSGLGLSLRSSTDLDCSKIARIYGGGGHAQAAGANIAWKDVPDFFASVTTDGIIDLSDSRKEDV